MPSFRAKARAVDLLGKGQIADLPTAICELWKNGYDAYGDNLTCELYLENYKGLKNPLFLITDDGSGMSKDDIEEKWLVLGTDSRIRETTPPPKEERFGKPPRIPMGEKGIGRLSVAYLGYKMMMFTKKQDEKCHALLMHWKLLENYNLYLNDVNIPIKEIISAKDVQLVFKVLIGELKDNLKSGNWEEHGVLSKEISKDLDETEFPDFLVEELEKLLKKQSHGTIFVIFDPHDQLVELTRGGERIDFDPDDPAIRYLRSSLSGIYNAFKEEEISFKTSFFIHSKEGKYNIILREDFFTREELLDADHYVSGSFDENGYFSGDLRVFDEKVKYSYRSVKPPGKTSYGPFKIEMGIMEGEPFNSRLPRAKFDIIQKKLARYGGLYIYRDKFRVLPYGRAEYDWLRFEERRSLHAGRHFFSHRRILGYIEISRKTNSNLKDKAGREGFIVNKAVREFQGDLIKFFEDLAFKYFRTTKESEKDTLREKQAKKIEERNKKVQEGEKKKSKHGKHKFNKELKEKSVRIETIISELNGLYDELNVENEKAKLAFNEIERLISEIENKKLELDDLKIDKPKRFKLTDHQVNKYHVYLEKYEESLKISKKCDELISNMQEKLSEENLKKDFEGRYKKFSGDIITTVKAYESRFEGAIDDLHQQIIDDIDKFKDSFEKETENLELDGTEEVKEVKKRIKTMKQIHSAITEKILEKYESFVSHIEDLSFEIDDDLLVGWYKEQYEKIKEKVEAMHELAQLGMSIEIIDHQFNVLYSEMSEAIDFFEEYTKKEKEVKDYYKQLREAFEHLENNHKLLTPLYRTMRRAKTEISGKEIKDYLKKFFAKRFERHNIKFTTGESFDQYVFFTYESVIKPVFINVVNNALYWLIPSEDRELHITYENKKILIMNSGEKIEYADLDNIFKLFFSRKPGGRGIGLYLVRTNLRTIGYDILATNDKKLNRLNGACFVIAPYEKEDGTDEF